MTTNLHLAEEIEFGSGPALWDADACCGAFQLGACSHTEIPYEDDLDAERPEDDVERWDVPDADLRPLHGPHFPLDYEPF